MRSRVRIRLLHILHFVMHFLFPLLKNSKSGVVIGVTGYEFARRGDAACSLAVMQQIQNVNTEMKPNMQPKTFEDSVNGKISMETRAI